MLSCLGALCVGPALAASSLLAVDLVEAADRVRLEDGQIVMPLGVVVPAPQRDGPTASAIAEAAWAQVSDLTADGVVLEEAVEDRWGRLRARVRLADGRTLEEALLAAGLAWAWPLELPPDRAHELLRIEREAHRRRRGLWAIAQLGEQDAGLPWPRLPRFAVVRARVAAVGGGGDYLFVNFGADHRRDFTIRIPRQALTRLRRAGIDPDRLAGQEVRARGWLFLQDGPMIELSEPFQIEVTAPPAG